MTREIKIGDRSVLMSANAATTYRFKQVFKKDILRIMMDEKAEQDDDDIMKLAYIMAQQAAGADMTKLNEETYIGWLEGFEPFAFFVASAEIMNLFQQQKEPGEEQKKTASYRADHDDGAVLVESGPDGAADL